MRHTVSFVFLTLMLGALGASPALADAGIVVPAPSWEYRFGPGPIDALNVALTPDFRYLAVATGRWSYHPVGKPEAVTTEGENAVYLFDLAQKRLVWRQAVAEGVVLVRGISSSGEFVAVQVGGSWHGAGEMPLLRTRGRERYEGSKALGPPEPGLRLYDRAGHLIAAKAPLQQVPARSPFTTFELRPVRDEEQSLPEPVRQSLRAAGILEVNAERTSEPFARTVRNGTEYLVAVGSDGAAKWEWRVPAEESTAGGRSQMLSYSPDGEYALGKFTSTAPPEAARTKHLRLFSAGKGLLWSRDFAVEGVSDITSLQVSNMAHSLLVHEGLDLRTAVDILGPDGGTKKRYAFCGIAPVYPVLSPNGRYWAAAFARWAEGHGVDDMGWTEGIHVLDCDSGEVVWRSPAMMDPVPVIVTDSGAVIVISQTDSSLTVFDPPR